MSIDTADKRNAMLNMGEVVIQPLFIPDGTIDIENKYHLLNLYSFVTTGGAIPDPEGLDSPTVAGGGPGTGQRHRKKPVDQAALRRQQRRDEDDLILMIAAMQTAEEQWYDEDDYYQ